MSDERALSRLHYEIIRGLADGRGCPTNPELAEQLGITTSQLEELLRHLSDIHGVVLHPHVCQPWIIHPFSLTPTLNWIEGGRGGWWAPCIWCAFGVACVVGGTVRIHTRIGGEAEPLVISVVDGEPADVEEIWVHFSIPPARAWDNVHQHCSLVLPFRSQEAIPDWCGRHRVPHGQDVPVGQVARLARLWYGAHGDPAWHKWTVAEAQEIFRRAGLDAPFWELGANHLGASQGKF